MKARSTAPRKTSISSSNGCSRDPPDAHPHEGVSPGERDPRRGGGRGPDRQDVPRGQVQDRGGSVLRGRRRERGTLRRGAPAGDDWKLRRPRNDRGRLGESAQKSDEADPEPEADQETPSTHTAPREV